MYVKQRQQIFQKFRSPTTTSVCSPISGAGRLPAGVHVVTITGVDTAFIHTKGFITLTFTSSPSLYTRLPVYIYSKNKTTYSYRFRTIVRALFASKALDIYADLLDRSLIEGLQLLRGMTLTVTVDYVDGYTINQTAHGYELSTHPGLVFTSLQDLAQYAATHNLIKATTTITGATPYGQHTNTRALYRAIETLNSTGVSSSNQGS